MVGLLLEAVRVLLGLSREMSVSVKRRRELMILKLDYSWLLYLFLGID